MTITLSHRIAGCFLLISIVLSACTDKVVIQLKPTTPVLALAGWITNKAGADTITFSDTQNYFSTSPSPGLQGAQMTLTSNAGGSEQLIETLPGKFLISKLRARTGLTYTLSIRYQGDTYSASTRIARSSPRLDSIRFDYKQKGLRIDTAGFYTFMYGQELAGSGDAVRFILYRNGMPANPPSSLNILNDKFIDGRYLSQFQLQQRSPFKTGDLVYLEAWSLSPEAYDFYTDLRTQLDNGGIFSRTPVNVRTNLLHTAGTGKSITGYFGGSLVTFLSAIVP